MPLWLLIKPFWKHIAVAIAVLLLVLYLRHAYHSALEAEYQRGVAETEDKQAEIIAARMLENEKRERAMALLAQSKQLELEIKDNANRVLTQHLERVASESRLCLADKVRSRPVPENPGPASGSDGTAGSNGLPETVGGTITYLLSECERNTNKLGVMQFHFGELKAKGF